MTIRKQLGKFKVESRVERFFLSLLVYKPIIKYGRNKKVGYWIKDAWADIPLSLAIGYTRLPSRICKGFIFHLAINKKRVDEGGEIGGITKEIVWPRYKTLEEHLRKVGGYD